MGGDVKEELSAPAKARTGHHPVATYTGRMAAYRSASPTHYQCPTRPPQLPLQSRSLFNSPSSSGGVREGFPALHGFVVVVTPVELQRHMVSTENTAENTHFSRSGRRGFGTLGLRITTWRWLRVISHSRLAVCVLLLPWRCLAVALPLPCRWPCYRSHIGHRDRISPNATSDIVTA